MVWIGGISKLAPFQHYDGLLRLDDTVAATAPPPAVDMIVRTRNRPALLARALGALSTQNHRPLSVIVVNDGGEPVDAIAERFRTQFDALVVVDHDVCRGRAAAANAGLARTRAEWVGFLDDDDTVDPDHLSALVRAGEASGAQLVYGGIRCIDADGQPLMVYNDAFDPVLLRLENYLPIHSVLFRRALLDRGLRFDTAFDLFEDWDFWLQAAEHTAFHHIDRVTGTYHLAGGQGSGLFGNEAAQREAARRIFTKWSPRWPADLSLALWEYARQAPRLADRVARSEAKLHTVLEDHRQLAELLSAAGRREAELSASLQAAFARVGELTADGERLGAALQGAMDEYRGAMALLEREQLSVVRPMARRGKRVLRRVWKRLPERWRARLWRRIRPAAQALAPLPTVDMAEQARWCDRIRESGLAGRFDVIVFPVIDWHFRIQRPQHLARELAAKGHRVVYLTTEFYRSDSDGGFRVLESPLPNVFVVQLGMRLPHPRLYETPLTAEQARGLAAALRTLGEHCGFGRCVSIVDLPFWRPVAAALPANLMVYDCMDYHAGFSTNAGGMLAEEEALLAQCDLLLTSSARLDALMREKAPGKPAALIRNGAEVDMFAKRPAVVQARDERPVIGYIGAISEWFDMDLVVACARANPQWQFVLVGSTFGCDVTDATTVPNIRFVGEVAYVELPGWLYSFDVCLIPFKLNELTACTNPVKVYEYLSAGKPVVATRMPELEAIADQVRLADDAPGFARAIQDALVDGRDPANAAARSAWAAGHSWYARVGQLEHAVAACYPPVSVIVLCFNNLALTRACLESIERHSHYPALELVVVDNASSDGTREYLSAFASERPWVTLRLNETNRGFAGGNNDGMAVAGGEVLILLNNDTVVTTGWVQGLVRHLQQDPGLGLVGPVTNNIGNEAMVDLGYADVEAMPAAAAAYTGTHARQRFANKTLAFFCVALRRSVFQAVGGLDEDFGVGFFEDDDYCNRARQAGWRLAIADDVFVHHHLSATFNTLSQARKQALFEANKKIYESKWGAWEPHRYRPRSPA